MAICPAKYITTQSHFAVGSVWKVIVKKNKKQGSVTMHSDGFECSCGGRSLRCDHIRGVEQLLCNGESFLVRLF